MEESNHQEWVMVMMKENYLQCYEVETQLEEQLSIVTSKGTLAVMIVLGTGQIDPFDTDCTSCTDQQLLL